MRSIICLLSIVLLFSCDTRKDFYKELNNSPELLIRKLDNAFVPVSLYQTTINDSFKLSQGNYNFEYSLMDDQSVESLHLKASIIGSGEFVYNTSLPKNGYAFKPNGIGFANISLKVMDSYEKTSNAALNLTVFDNLAPVAVLNYQNTAVLDPLEYRLKAEESFDLDKKFGGTIINYEFSISPDYKVTTPYNFINYIFPSTGIYQISLRVQDNNSVWSPSAVAYITVN